MGPGRCTVRGVHVVVVAYRLPGPRAGRGRFAGAGGRDANAAGAAAPCRASGGRGKLLPASRAGVTWTPGWLRSRLLLRSRHPAFGAHTLRITALTTSARTSEASKPSLSAVLMIW